MYRAGSVFGGLGETNQVIRHAHYEGSFVDLYSNAGNYGVTTPISTVRHTSSSGVGTLETRPSTDRSPIAIPQQNPEEEEGFYLPPSIREPTRTPGDRVPTIDELLDRPRGTMPLPTPVTPPARPRTAPPSFDDIPTMSFSPNDEAITPPSTFPTIRESGMPGTLPTLTDPPITLEELRRLDPTIQDVQIISIEDVAPGTVIR